MPNRIDVSANLKSNIAKLKSELSVSSVMAVPRISKVTLSTGTGMHRSNKEMLGYIEKALAAIAGQQPAVTKSRQSIAGFKLRAGEVVGFKVTLRGSKMNDFLNRLLNITLPRVRDFRGIDAKHFDKLGNLTLGFRDQQPFAELGHEAIDRPFGIGVTISIANSDREKSLKFLQALGFPMKVS